MVGRPEHLILAHALAQGDIGLENPSRRRTVLELEKLPDGETRITVKAVESGIVHRVGHLVCPGISCIEHVPCLHYLVDIPVLIIGAQIRVEQGILAERTVWTVSPHCIVNRDAVLQEELVETVAEVQGRGLGTPLGTFHHTGSLVESCIQLVSQGLGTSFEGDGMTVLHGSAQRLRQPVGIYTPADLPETGLVVPQGSEVGLGIETCPPFRLYLFLGIHQVVGGEVRNLHADIAAVCHIDSSRARSQGLDDDDTVGSLGTIDGRSRSILQDCYGGNPVRVEVGHCLHINLETIQHQQRLVRIGIVLSLKRHEIPAGPSSPRKGRCPSHTHVGQPVRVRPHLEVVHHAETRVYCADSLCDIGRGDFLYVLSFHRHHRTGITLQVPVEDTCHHHLVQLVLVHLHHDFQSGLAVTWTDLDLLCLHSYERKFQHYVGAVVKLQSEVTVHISGNTDCSAFEDYSGSRHRYTVLIDDHSCHFHLAVLRKEGRHSDQTPYKGENQSFNHQCR